MLASYTFRTALTLATGLARPRLGLLDTARLPFRAWPTDLDLYGHVNNGRYLTLMDFGRLDHSLRTGLLPMILRAKCQPVAANAQIRFSAEILPFQRCVLGTSIRGWDDRRLYYTQRIERRGVLCARAEIEIAIRAHGGTISLREVFERAGRVFPEELLRAKADQAGPAPLTT